MAIEKIKHVSLADRVYKELEAQILSCNLKSGDAIPEAPLAKKFGVSRTPIREAIHRLAEYDLVELVPNNHAVVYTITKKEAADIAIVRIGLEQMALDHITSDSLEEHLPELSRLSEECESYLKDGDRASVFLVDSLFHLELIKCSKNLSLTKLYKRLDSQIQLLRVNQNLPNSELLMYLNHHGEIIEYLKSNKIDECKKLLEKHVYHDISSESKGSLR